MVIDVTSRCNLRCPHCLAAGHPVPEPTLAQLEQLLQSFPGGPGGLVQLGGGEPTLRDDLPQVVQAARQAGFRYVQLNTNGLRLARTPPT